MPRLVDREAAREVERQPGRFTAIYKYLPQLAEPPLSSGREQGNLPYPEGTACADVMIAGKHGGDLAKPLAPPRGMALPRLYPLHRRRHGRLRRA